MKYLRRIGLVKVLAGSVVGVALVLGLWTYSQAAGNIITACVKKDGFIYVIGNGFRLTQCERNDTLLSWNIQGPKGDKGETGPQGLRGDKGDQGLKGDSGSINVTDANGNDLGLYVEGSHSHWYRILIPSLGRWVDINPSSGAIEDAATHETSIPVYFVNSDCIGQAAIKVNDLERDLSIEFDVNEIVDAGTIRNHRLFKVDSPLYNVYPLYSHLYQGNCVSEYDSGLGKAASEVQLPFSLPVSVPIFFKSS